MKFKIKEYVRKINIDNSRRRTEINRSEKLDKMK